VVFWWFFGAPEFPIGCVLAMAAPLFDDEWLTQSATEYDEAYASFQAAVTSSLSGTDEGIRQVGTFVFNLFLLLCISVMIRTNFHFCGSFYKL
jgi:hypothetical protein